MKDTHQSIQYESLKMVESSASIVTIGRVLAILMLIILLCLIFVPWQQSIPGHGRVTLLSPNERPQTVNAPINARLNQWLVHEGERVQMGDILMELIEVDPKYLDPQLLQRLNSQLQARLAKKVALKAGVEALRKQLATQKRLASFVIPAATVKIEQTKHQYDAAKQSWVTTKQNYARTLDLYHKGLRSKRDLELAEMNQARVEAELEVAERQTKIAHLGQGEIEANAQAKIQDVEVKLAKVGENIAQVDYDILKLEVDIANYQTRVEQRKVRAPVDGKVVRILVFGKGDTVKSSDELAIIVPTATEQVVELYIKDHDAPLLSPNRLVRLQFSGWPALQFSGWPAIAVGTFGGRVAVIDSVDDGQGLYRVLVVPDQERIHAGLDEPWPVYPYLRPGTRANGWVMLETVSMGFELWRQFNAFPPVIKTPGELSGESYVISGE